MKQLLLVNTAVLFLLFSCDNKNIESPAPDKFMSVTAGSTWEYQSTNNLNNTSGTYTLTSTNQDTLINNKQFHVYTNSGGTGNEYYNITGNDYFAFRNLGVGTGGSVQTNYLKDNAAVGINWVEIITLPVTGFPSGVPVTLTNTITQKDFTKTVNAKTYTGVIKVTTSLNISGLPAGTITSDIQSFYAPKVGLIESINIIKSITLAIDIDQTTILKVSNIK